MQSLTEPPRDGFTAAQVTAVLTGPQVQVDVGLELLDSNDQFVQDISDQLTPSGSSVERDCAADVQGTCTLVLSQALNWGTARVRPYMLLTGPDDTGTVITCRFDLGVFVLTTPQRVVGESVDVYQVTGYDKNYLLQNIVGDSRTYTAGSGVLTSVEAVIAEANPGGAVLLDATSAGATLPADKVFPFSSSEQASYLSIANALLATISYRPLWVDQDGVFRSEPTPDPASVAEDWTFTADDPLQSLIGVARTLTNDLWGAPNQWIFTNTTMPDVDDGLGDGGTVPATPTSGDGIYKYDNLTTGPSSQSALGFVRRAAYFIDAADQASLQAAAVIQIALDSNVIWSVDTTMAVWPLAGHYDVYVLQDAMLGGSFKVQQMKWSLPLSVTDNGGDMTVTWQGAT